MKRVFSWWMAAVVTYALSACFDLAHGATTAPDATPASLAADQAALDFAQQVLSKGDHNGQPFVIVDKAASLVLVYRPDGTLVGTSSALLGRAKGDQIMPGVGERTQSRQLRPEDRTTPAGRFVTEPGHNESGEAVVWIDYAAALAIHRLRPSPPAQRRPQRMASSNPLDKRISAGCVVVPVSFYLDVIEPVLGHQRGVVYIMKEDGRQPS